MKNFFKTHIVKTTLSVVCFLAITVASTGQCPPSIPSDFSTSNNATDCAGDFNLDGTLETSVTTTSTCLTTPVTGGCIMMEGTTAITDFSCGFCVDIQASFDVSGDVSAPATADGFAFSFIQAPNPTSGFGGCATEDLCDDSNGCSNGGGNLGYDRMQYASHLQQVTIEIDLYDNGCVDECPGPPVCLACDYIDGDPCTQHISVIESDATKAVTNETKDCIDAAGNLEDGSLDTYSFCWDPASNELTVAINGTVYSTVSIDLETHFTDECGGAPNVYPSITTAQEPGTIASFCSVITYPLGIRDESLTAKLKNETVEVSWIEAKDYVTDYVVEKSTNGKDFMNLKSVKAEEDNTKYVIVDESPIEGFNYYRVKEIEFTGIESYSEVKVVEYNKKNNFIIEQSSKEIHIYSKNRSDYTAYIFNSSGKLMKECSSFENVTIDVSDLSGGLYFVNIVSAEEVQTKKILLLND